MLEGGEKLFTLDLLVSFIIIYNVIILYIRCVTSECLVVRCWLCVDT